MFKLGTYYHFKDSSSESEFRRKWLANHSIADAIHAGQGFTPTELNTNGSTTGIQLRTGEIFSFHITANERQFFKELSLVQILDDELDDCEECCEEKALQDFSEFPVTKITISNNSEAWTVYQMLKAHFKE